MDRHTDAGDHYTFASPTTHAKYNNYQQHTEAVRLKYTKTPDNVFDMIELLTWLAVISRCFNLVQLRAVHSDWYTSAQYWQWTWRLWHCLTQHSADKSRKEEVYWVTFTRWRQRLSAMTLLVAKDSQHLSNLEYLWKEGRLHHNDQEDRRQFHRCHTREHILNTSI